jgi:hypothetical protein
MFSIWNERLENFENLFKRYSERRRKEIYKSLIRPLYQEILKCLYLIIVMIFDTFLLLELIIFFDMPINIVIFSILSLILIYIEIIFYNKLWGINGKWSIDKYKKKKNN